MIRFDFSNEISKVFTVNYLRASECSAKFFIDKWRYVGYFSIKLFELRLTTCLINEQRSVWTLVKMFSKGKRVRPLLLTLLS